MADEERGLKREGELLDQAPGGELGVVGALLGRVGVPEPSAVSSRTWMR
jgi:hypothetical protein